MHQIAQKLFLREKVDKLYPLTCRKCYLHLVGLFDMHCMNKCDI